MSPMLRTLGLWATIVALFLCWEESARADIYTVTRTDDPNPGACLPADCSLREALTASNGSPTVDDLIVLPASATPYLNQYEELSFPISDAAEVRGAGADRAVVEGDGKRPVFTTESPGVVIVGITIRGGNGGIQNNDQLTLRRVSVEHNKANAAGGGIQTNGLLFVESSFLGFNVSTAGAGGAIQANAPVTVVNSTIAGNSSSGPSAILGNDSVTISSSAIAFNTSEGSTPAAVTGIPLTVRDSVFSANRNSAASLSCGSMFPVISLGGNVEDGSSCATAAGDRPNAAAGLGTLALHGGTTPVYDLLPGSAAIDAATGCPPLDQRGAPRPQGAACDSGPYEVQPLASPSADTEVRMSVGKGRLILSAKGVTRIRLTCSPTEAHPPCSGTVVLRTRGKVDLGAKRRKLRLATANFSVGVGETKKIALRLPAGKAELVRDEPVARRALILVRAKDAVGNRRLIESPRRIVPR